jgi:transcriptional regulator with XRE-family HTH domain
LRNRIRQVRQLRGLTQAELAERVGATAATVSRLEKDTMTVSTDWLDRFAAALDIHGSELLERPERPSVPILGKAGRSGRVSPGPEEAMVVDFPSKEAVAVEIAVQQGPYTAGERLIGEKLYGASMLNGVGRDCIVALKSGAIVLARVAGAGPCFILIPPESRGPILYDQEVKWIAPLVMRMQILS